MDDLETGTFGALLELLNSGEAASWGLRGPSGDSEVVQGKDTALNHLPLAWSFQILCCFQMAYRWRSPWLGGQSQRLSRCGLAFTWCLVRSSSEYCERGKKPESTLIYFYIKTRLIIAIIMCMDVLPASMSLYHVCTLPVKVRIGHQIWNWNYRWLYITI